MTIKIGQHKWGKRNSDGSATCLKCRVYCPCERVSLDVDRFYIREDCIVHKRMNTARCPQ